jgi:hypothetical protein
MSSLVFGGSKKIRGSSVHRDPQNFHAERTAQALLRSEKVTFVGCSRLSGNAETLKRGKCKKSLGLKAPQELPMGVGGSVCAGMYQLWK